MHKCKGCPYETYNIRDFNNHVNRNIPCNKKLHGNFKPKDDNPICPICNKELSRPDAVQRHIKTVHKNIISKRNITGNNNTNTNNVIRGNHNTANTTNNINSGNNINITNNIVIKPIVYDYHYGDINDLTLFEQYIVLISDLTPYIKLLDKLNLNSKKPEYHNIHIGSITRDTIDVVINNEWIKEVMSIALSNIFMSKRSMMEEILNKFRYFLNNKAIKILFQFYNDYRSVMPKKIKVHLYNNRKQKKTTKEIIPTDKDDPVFWALSKNFEWKDVNDILTKAEKLGVNFNDNSIQVESSIRKLTRGDRKLRSLFKPLLARIDMSIKKKDNSEQSSSSSWLETDAFVSADSDDESTTESTADSTDLSKVQFDDDEENDANSDSKSIEKKSSKVSDKKNISTEKSKKKFINKPPALCNIQYDEDDEDDEDDKDDDEDDADSDSKSIEKNSSKVSNKKNINTKKSKRKPNNETIDLSNIEFDDDEVDDSKSTKKNSSTSSNKKNLDTKKSGQKSDNLKSTTKNNLVRSSNKENSSTKKSNNSNNKRRIKKYDTDDN